jgi:hypothetical protein
MLKGEAVNQFIADHVGYTTSSVSSMNTVSTPLARRLDVDTRTPSPHPRDVAQCVHFVLTGDHLHASGWCAPARPRLEQHPSGWRVLVGAQEDATGHG